LPHLDNFVEPFWHLYPIRVNPNKRNQIFRNLRYSGIGVQVNYELSYYHPIFKTLNYEIPYLREAENYYRQEISLPIHVNLTKRDLKKVINKVKESLV